MQKMCFCLLAVAALFAGTVSALAQSQAAINGTVTDATGALIPDAAVTLINIDTKVEQKTTTRAAGTYTIINVLPGNYVLTISKPGFGTKTQTGIVLQVNQTESIDFSLSPGSSTATVEVSAESIGVETSTSELGTVITTRSVNELPLNGRNFTQLLTLTPGVSPISTGQNAGGGGGFAGSALGSFTFPSINGQRNRSNIYLLDGANNLNSFVGSVNYYPVLDEIQEFKVQSHNDLAEFGQVTGGIVNIVTKGGSKTFHGAAWDFLRNDKLDAANYNFTSTPQPKNPLRQNQFGGIFTGPVYIPRFYTGRDHTFFSFAYEGIHLTERNQGTPTAPSPQELNGDFSDLSTPIYNPFVAGRPAFARNIIPTNLINPATQLYAKTLFPTAPVVNGQNGTVFDNQKNATTQNSYSGRVDQSLGTHDYLFGRVSYYHQVGSGSAGYPGLTRQAIVEGWNIVVHDSHTFNANTILDLRFGRNFGNDTQQTLFNNAPSGFADQLVSNGISNKFIGQLTSVSGNVVPFLGANGYLNSVGTGNDQAVQTQISNTFEYAADFTRILGRHTLKAGGIFATNNIKSPITSVGEAFDVSGSSNGVNGGNSLASLLLGVPLSALKRDVVETESRGSVDGAYIQDQFKATSKLTINAGLRWDVSIWPTYGNFKDGSGYVGDLDLSNGTYLISGVPPACSSAVGAPCIPGGTLPAGVVITPYNDHSLHKTDTRNFQGRFGLAYRVHENTVVRGGYSRFYDEWSAVVQLAQNVNGNWPSIGLLQAENLNQGSGVATATANDPLSQGTGAVFLPAATPFGNQAFYYDPKLKTPYTDQWNVAVEQGFGPRAALSLAYVGSSSKALDVGGLHNAALTPGPGPVNPRRQYPNLPGEFYDQGNGYGNYNALEARINGSFAGLTYLTSYTWSKSLDAAASGYFSVENEELTDPYNLQRDYGPSGFDLRNIFSASLVYDLPIGRGKRLNITNPVLNQVIGGWQVNGITTLTSGLPYDISTGIDISNTGQGFTRLNQIGNPNPAHRSRSQWFNTAAFVLPPQYTFGTMSRNSLRADSYKNQDVSLFKKFPIRDRLSLELRGEAFNVTNTTTYGVPHNGYGDSLLGVVNSTRNANPRLLQLAAKLSF